MKTHKPLASLSLDLDNLWSYLKIKGDPAWSDYPSYLLEFLPLCLDLLDELNLKITFFIVGRDAYMPIHKDIFKEITKRGHEVGNHTYDHEPSMHTFSKEGLEEQIIKTEEAIEQATGAKPLGFRGPGFTWSKILFEILNERGYLYDSSTLPTYIGPLARTYYYWKTGLKGEDKKKREELFGSFKNGLRSISPYLWKLDDQRELLEIPVTTIPAVKTPFHMSYLTYLGSISPFLAKQYFNIALQACRAAGTAPNFLLHPTDFLDTALAPRMSFFPGMNVSACRKKREFYRHHRKPFKTL